MGVKTPLNVRKAQGLVKIVNQANNNGRLTGELLCPPPDVADGEFVENPMLTLGAILKAR